MQWQVCVTAWIKTVRVTYPAIRRVFDELTGMLALLLPGLLPWVCERASHLYHQPFGDELNRDSATVVRFINNFLSHLSYSLSPFRPLKGRQLSLRVAAGHAPHIAHRDHAYQRLALRAGHPLPEIDAPSDPEAESKKSNCTAELC